MHSGWNSSTLLGLGSAVKQHAASEQLRWHWFYVNVTDKEREDKS
jgi:hypothetical protein